MNQPVSHSKNSRLSTWQPQLRKTEQAVTTQLATQTPNETAPTGSVPEGVRLKAQAARVNYDLGEYAKAVRWLDNGGIAGLDTETVFAWAAELERKRKYVVATNLLKILVEHQKATDVDPSPTYFQVARLYRLRHDWESFVESVICCLESGNWAKVLSLMASIKRPALYEPLLENIERIRCKIGEKGYHPDRLLLAEADIYQLNGDFDRAAPCVGKVRDRKQFKGRRFAKHEPARPAFLIIGSTKSGTTGMYHTLCQHPQIFGAMRKEIRYFGKPHATLDWYLSHFPRLPKGRGLITGEATPNYYMKDVQQQIRTTLPGVKLVCMLRNPADRAVSQYFHGVKLGGMRQPLENFFDPEELKQLSQKSDMQLEEIAWACGNGNFQWNNCLVAGLYHFYLRRWFEVFGDQLLLVTMEEFRKDHGGTVNRVCDFLGVKRCKEMPLTNQYSGSYRGDPKVVEKVKSQLAEFYAPHNQRLADEFGVSFE